MGTNTNYAKDNRGFHGEPPDQFIPPRSRERNSSQDGFYRIGQHSGSHESIQMQTMGQRPPVYPGNLPYVMQPDQYGYPTIAHVQYAHPGYRMQIPANQYMARDYVTPMPPDQGNDRPYVQPSIGGIIFKRIVSSLFIILDICLNWLQFGAWVGQLELPGWINFLEVANSLKGKSPIKSQCDEGSSDLTTAFGVITAIGTAYGCVRMTNMIGETIIEYQKQNTSETEPRCRGFQILHGWAESTLDILCEDLPQVILLVIFSWQCNVDYISMIKVLIWMLFKMLKNNVRNSTCKQIYKPCCGDWGNCCGDCCKDCCKDCCSCKDCCVYRYDLICCCTVFYFRPCGCCQNEDCFECQSYEICPDCTCKRAGRCCGEIENDPEWAKNLFEKLQYLFSLLVIAIIVLSLLKQFSLIGQQHGF